MSPSERPRPAVEHTTPNPAPRPADAHSRTDESKITRHVLLAAIGAGSAALDSIHQDLFDSSGRVVVSALDAVSGIGDPKSLKFVARLLGRNDKRIVLHAIRTIGTLKSPVAVRLLLEVYRTTRSDEVKFESLRALAAADPNNPELTRLLDEQSRSPLASAELRSVCTVLGVEVGGVESLAAALSAAPPDTVDRIIEWSKGRAEARQPVIEYGLAHYQQLTGPQRIHLIDAAGESTPPFSQGAILLGLKDETAEVRFAAYRATGSETVDPTGLPRLVEILGSGLESSFPIEDEAVAAIARLETISEAVQRLSVTRILQQAESYFDELSTQRNRVGSEKIELGWLILKSAEYLEYYAGEDFRETLVRYLKGGTYHTAAELLAMLKTTAQRVEVRHIDGFKALVEIIKDPKRPGTALIVRELNGAKLGKRATFGRLIRSLRLLRLAPTLGRESVALVRRVFSWSREARLYRLAEAALYALAKFDASGATSLVRELLLLPIESKILAIASARILQEIDTAQVLPSVELLLQGGMDSYVVLNLIDALRTVESPASPGVLSALITLTRTAPDIDVARAAGRYLATRPVANLLSRATEDFDRLDEAHQAIVLDAIRMTVEESRPSHPEALSEFLYGYLRASTNRHRGLAATLLLRLGDEFAPRVISRLLAEGDDEMRADVVRELAGIIDTGLTAEVLKLLPEPHARLHEAIRRTLSGVDDPATVELIRRTLLGKQADGEDAGAVPGGEAELKDFEAGILKERQAFRFEHEFTKELGVMFTDIQGYSAKAQKLTTLQVNSLIEDYEAILLPTVEAHRGRLIKRMGDGHMFVFDSALHAGLAALRLQKALKRFNSYREDLMRVVVRVGIHYGQVVQRDGDVFGNNVNIASRLESSSKGGSALVSKAVWERWEGRIHARELGKITVKNISEPIAVYEPYEIQIDFPPELDPLQGAREGGPSSASRGGEAADGESPGGRQSAGEGPGGATEGGAPGESPVEAITVDSEAVRYLSGVFGRLDELCTRIQSGELELEALRVELGRSWERFQELVVARLQENPPE